MSRSQNARSERIEYIAINTVDFNNISGGTLRRPPAAYIVVEHVVELGEHRVDDDTDLADRMIRRDQILGATTTSTSPTADPCSHA